MRLINCQTLELEDYFGRQAPHYAILSHRWTDDEVTYQDFKKGRRKDSTGYRKIVQCCELALKNSFLVKHLWVDTCCIDKKSSAELSEAINSMYKYYAGAVRCYAYLYDVENADAADRFDPMRGLYRALSTSSWFTRGWTLQELLAPKDVVFFDMNWQSIGHKCTHHMLDCKTYPGVGPRLNGIISEITGVSGVHLESPEQIPSVSIACRMSWASTRTTTRIEDMAYCLLGLLDVNMPLLYGEGPKAFFRLQEEIVRRSTDMSIFAWTPNQPSQRFLGHSPKVSGIFASSPADFEHSGTVMTPGMETWPYTLTNTGLSLRAIATRRHLTTQMGWEKDGKPREALIITLNCFQDSSKGFDRGGQEEDYYSNAIRHLRGGSVQSGPSKAVPVDIALVEVMQPGQGHGAVAPIKVFQRVHDIDEYLIQPAVTKEPESVQIYIKAFDGVNALPVLPLGRLTDMLKPGDRVYPENLFKLHVS